MSNRNATNSSVKSKNLVVKGTGYASPIHSSGQQQSTSRTTVRRTAHPNVSSSMRRAGSVGNVSASSSCSSRVPLVPQPISSSFASSRAIVCNNCSASSDQTIICNCQHPADVTFLENVYVQNLQTQIEVLELENSYLRGSGAQPKSILREDLKEQRRHSESTYKPSSHSSANSQPMQRESSSYIYSGNGRKRVEFLEETQVVNGKNPAALPYEPAGPSAHSTASTSSQQQHYQHQQFQQQQNNRQRFQDEDLFLKLEQAFQNEHLLEERLKIQAAQNRKLSISKADLEDRLHSMEGKMSKERRSLMEDGVELQRRLDELTPLLAEKEARLAKLENEREELGGRLRSASLKVSSLQARIDERQREESLYSELDSDRKLEIERLRDRLMTIEKSLEDQQLRETNMTDELTSLRQKLKEEESAARHERALYEKAVEQNAELAKENSELISRIRRFELQLEQHQENIIAKRKTETHQREVEELKRVEKNLRSQLQLAEERVNREQEKLREIEIQERERMTKGEEHRESLTRIQHELEALQALSHSLASENKGLREERIAMDEQLEFLQNKLLSKENDILDLTKRLEEFKEKYIETSNRLRLEITRFSERSVELEEIVKRVHDLSDSIPRHPLSAGFYSLLSSLKHTPPGPSPKHSGGQLEVSSTEIVSASRISNREITEGRTVSESHIDSKSTKKSHSHLPQSNIPSSSSDAVSVKCSESKKGKASAGLTATFPKYIRQHRRSSVVTTSRRESSDDETTSATHRDDLAQKYRRKMS